ncbi:MAG: flavin reductase family protein [Gemmatimonadota bacterium]
MKNESARFRQVMGHFATGVTVVTGVDPDGERVGLTANSVASVSLDPPLLLVCLDRGSKSLAALLETGAFGISVLHSGQEAVARRFAGEPTANRFRDLEVRLAPSGLPFLPDAIAWFQCRVWRTIEAGDHTILIGEVEDGGTKPGSPLVFFQGRYGIVAP